MLHGRIESFDEDRGDGVLRSDDDERLYFHCVDIADGSRTIDVDTNVTARRGVGHLGHDEAVAVAKLAHP